MPKKENMKERILGMAKDAGLSFSRKDEQLDTDTLRDAFQTGHVTPDEFGETFVRSVLEGLGLENDLVQRREDKIEKALAAFEANRHSITPWTPLAEKRRAFVEKLIDAAFGRSNDEQEEALAKSAFKKGDLVEVVHPIFSGRGTILEHGWLENIHRKEGEPAFFLAWVISPADAGAAWPGVLDIIDPMHGVDEPRKSMRKSEEP